MVAAAAGRFELAAMGLGMRVVRGDGVLVVLVPVLSGGLLVGRRDGTPGQAAVRITIGANVPPTIATRRRAFQDCLMHRQDCSGPRKGAHGNRIKPLH